MTAKEIRIETTKERIKAYIYFGVEAEMERIENTVQTAIHKDDGDETYYAKQNQIFERKIGFANKRIDDLQVFLGTINDE